MSMEDAQTRLEKMSTGVSPLEPLSVSLVAKSVKESLLFETGAEEGLVRLPNLSGRESANFLRAAARHRVVGILARHAQPGSGGELWEQLQERAKRVAIKASENLRQAQAVHEILTTARIPHRFIKGPGLSLLISGRLGLKDFSTDVDVIVPRQWVVKCHNVLCAERLVPHNGATPASKKTWASMLRAYPELTYAGTGITVDLHWRLGAVPGTFDDAHVIIDRGVTVHHSGYQLPVLAMADALDLECYKLLEDRSFSLSQVVSISILSKKLPGEPGSGGRDPLASIVREAFLFSKEALSADGISVPEKPSGESEGLARFLRRNWGDFSTLGLAYPSHRRWSSLPPAREIVDRYRVMRFSSKRRRAVKILLIQLFVRPYEAFGIVSWRERLNLYWGLIARMVK